MKEKNKMKDKLMGILFCLMLCVIGGLVVFSCTGCNSFKLVKTGISDECDMYATTLATLGGKGGGNESSFVGAVWTPCSDSIARKRQKILDNECAKEFFPPDGIINREDYKQYNKYLECTKTK
jgi:hypothetical protein